MSEQRDTEKDVTHWRRRALFAEEAIRRAMRLYHEAIRDGRTLQPTAVRDALAPQQIMPSVTQPRKVGQSPFPSSVRSPGCLSTSARVKETLMSEQGDEIMSTIERSSLGTPEAQALRATVSDELAARIVARARDLEHTAESDALSRVRAWVESEVSDWYDPVIDPDLHDALRIVAGLPPIERGSDA